MDVRNLWIFWNKGCLCGISYNKMKKYYYKGVNGYNLEKFIIL